MDFEDRADRTSSTALGRRFLTQKYLENLGCRIDTLSVTDESLDILPAMRERPASSTITTRLSRRRAMMTEPATSRAITN